MNTLLHTQASACRRTPGPTEVAFEGSPTLPQRDGQDAQEYGRWPVI